MFRYSNQLALASSIGRLRSQGIMSAAWVSSPIPTSTTHLCIALDLLLAVPADEGGIMTGGIVVVVRIALRR